MSNKPVPLVDGDLKNIDPADGTTTVHTHLLLKEGDLVNVQDADGATCRGQVEEVIYVVCLDLSSKRAGRA